MAVLRSALGLLLLAGAAGGAAAAPLVEPPPARAPGEYAVKAAFLYNFAKFVEWPPQAFGEPGAPVVLCVLGVDPFGAELDGTVEGKSVQGRPVAVRRLDGLGGLERCHVLFVSNSERARFDEVLAAAGRESVLTVGEDAAFGRAGGMITFVVRERRVRFEIDPGAAERAGLRLSSRLLDLAELVRMSDSGGRRRR